MPPSRVGSSKRRYAASPPRAKPEYTLSWWHFWDIWTSQRDPSGLLIAKTYAREASLIDERDARAHFPIGLAQMMMGTARRGQG